MVFFVFFVLVVLGKRVKCFILSVFNKLGWFWLKIFICFIVNVKIFVFDFFIVWCWVVKFGNFFVFNNKCELNVYCLIFNIFFIFFW